MEVIEEINKILEPLLSVAEFEEEDKTVVKEQFYKVIFFKLMAKIIGNLSSQEASILNDKLEKASSNEERLNFFEEEAQRSENIQGAIQEFLLKDLSEIINKLLRAFSEKATPEQKIKFETALAAV